VVEYLTFEEVALALNCSTTKVRQFVLEDKTLKATRITPNGDVLDLPMWDGNSAYGLTVCDHLSDAGVITSDISRMDAFGKIVMTKTLTSGCLRVERADLEAYMRERDSFKVQQGASLNAPATHWPWGNHHTDSLGHLEAAALRYWVNYDPTDATTAPTNKAVSEWLIAERKVSQKMAESIASILRPDGLATGPRK
jgi:hypothetical protein